MPKLRELREGEEQRLRDTSRGHGLRVYAVKMSDMFFRGIDRFNKPMKWSSFSAEDVTGDTARAAVEVREAIIHFRRALKRLRNALFRYRELRKIREERIRSGALQFLHQGTYTTRATHESEKLLSTPDEAGQGPV